MNKYYFRPAFLRVLAASRLGVRNNATGHWSLVIGHWSLVISVLVLFCAPALADDPPSEVLPGVVKQLTPQAQMPIVKLTLHPAAEPSPALKYRLIPGYWERKPGNAAPFYYRSLLVLNQNQALKDLQKTEAENLDRWLEQPCEGQVREEIRKWVDSYPRPVLGELREAVYREECNFDFGLHNREGIELISFLLPEVQEMRSLGRFLRLKARVDISEGKYDQAIESLKFGYQISKDVASEPLLINGLVGIAVASTMNAEAEHWIGSPGSPNLYWALTSLPQPLVDLRPALLQESRLPETMFPFIKDADTADRTAEEWQRIMVDMTKKVQEISGEQNKFDDVARNFVITAVLMRAYPFAKAELKKAGYDEQKLEKMAVAQVVAIHTQRTVRYIADEFAKAAYLPTRQREEYYNQLEKRLIRDRWIGPGFTSRESIPIASLLMPAVGAALSAQSRHERDLAALKTLEAIRAHLAATGELPEKLDDITVLPVPLNPITDQPFPYRRNGEKAILEVPPTGGRPGGQQGKIYELTAAKK